MRRFVHVVVLVGLVASWVVVGGAPVSAEAVRVESIAAASAGSVSYGGTGVQGVSPARLLDTRPGNSTVDSGFAGGGALGAGDSVELVVAGRGGVPVVGVGAVVLNVTATETSAPTFVSVFPTGDLTPITSNVNLVPGETNPNLVVVKVGRDGKVTLRNEFGSVHLIADVSGWFPEGSDFVGVSPARLLETRPGFSTVDGVSANVGAVGPDGVVSVRVTGRGPVPEGAGSVVVNVTATQPTEPTFVTVFPAGGQVPLASNINLMTAGQTRPNLVVAAVGDGGQISLYNYAGSVHLIVDVLGWFPANSGFNGLYPARLLDTRPGELTVDGQGAGGGALGADTTIQLTVAGRGGVPAGAGAVALNVAVTGPTADTFLTVFPGGEAAPLSSNLNALIGQTVANMVIVKLGPDGTVALRNYDGAVHVVADVLGWFPDPSSQSRTMIETLAGTVMAGAGDVISATWNTPTSGVAVIAASGDVPPVGGHLAINPNPSNPDGFLGKVTSITPGPGNATTVTVVDSTLQDAFSELDVSGPITPPPATVTTALASMDVQRTVQAAENPDGCEGAGNTVELAVGLGSLGGTFDFSLSKGYAKLEATMAPSLTVTGSVGGSFTCEKTSPELKIGVIGPILFSARTAASFTISAAAEFSLSASAPLTIGFVYEDGEATNLSSLDIGGSGSIDGDAEAKGSLTFEMSGEIKAKAFDVLGLTASVGPEIPAEFILPDCVNITANITLKIGAEAKKWGYGWEFSLAEIKTPDLNIFRSDGCVDFFRQWTIEIQSTFTAPVLEAMGIAFEETQTYNTSKSPVGTFTATTFFRQESPCPPQPPAVQTIQGSGTGVAELRLQSLDFNPTTFGLELPVLEIAAHPKDRISVTETVVGCGNNFTTDSTQLPQSIPLFLPCSLEELELLPRGHVLVGQYEGPAYNGILRVSYRAVKVVAPTETAVDEEC